MSGTHRCDLDPSRDRHGSSRGSADRRQQRHRNRSAAQRVRPRRRREPLESGSAQRRSLFGQDHQGQSGKLVRDDGRLRLHQRGPHRLRSIRRRAGRRDGTRNRPHRAPARSYFELEGRDSQYSVRNRRDVFSDPLRVRRPRRRGAADEDVARRRDPGRSLRTATDVASRLRSRGDGNDHGASWRAARRARRRRQ